MFIKFCFAKLDGFLIFNKIINALNIRCNFFFVFLNFCSHSFNSFLLLFQPGNIFFTLSKCFFLFFCSFVQNFTSSEVHLRSFIKFLSFFKNSLVVLSFFILLD